MLKLATIPVRAIASNDGGSDEAGFGEAQLDRVPNFEFDCGQNQQPASGQVFDKYAGVAGAQLRPEA